jgi:hypothetical protein
LKKTEYRDCGKYCINPFQGWYRPYIYDLSQRFDPEEQRWCLHEEEPLCLVECSLEAYAKGELPIEALTCLGDILSFFEEYHKQVILRFAYDFDGSAMAKEPTELGLILLHMEQIARITKSYEEMILCFQGLFIGNWGEMHGSRYSTDRSMQTLYEGFRKAFGPEVVLAVRRLEWLQQWSGKDSNLTLFDDGIFGSTDDLGTFQGPRDAALSGIQEATHGLPAGGELLSGGLLQGLFSKELILDSLKQMHISYLNNQYDTKALSYLKEQGIFEAIENHMGYRLLVQGIEQKDQKLLITVSNTGWGDLFLPCVFSLVDGNDQVLAQQQIPMIMAGATIQLTFPTVAQGAFLEGRLRGKYPVCFCNHGETTFELGESVHA